MPDEKPDEQEEFEAPSAQPKELKAALRAFLRHPFMKNWEGVQKAMFNGRCCRLNPRCVEFPLYVCECQRWEDCEGKSYCPFDGVRPDPEQHSTICGNFLQGKKVQDLLEPCIQMLTDLDVRFPDEPGGRRRKVKK